MASPSSRSRTRSPKPRSRSPAARAKKVVTTQSPPKRSPSAASRKRRPANTPMPKRHEIPPEEDEEITSEEEEDDDDGSWEKLYREDDDEDDDEDEEDDDDESYEIYFVLDKDDFATKLALRVIYSLKFVSILYLTLWPQMAFKGMATEAEILNNYRNNQLWSVTALGEPLLFVAAAQSSYEAQRRALQYSMVASLMMCALSLKIGLGEAAQAEGVPKTNNSMLLARQMLYLLIATWACYIYKPEQPVVTEGDAEDDE